MATRMRESGVKGKEKKGNQGDNTMPKRATTTTTTTSRLMSSSSSVANNNSVPNYLRPTNASTTTTAGDKPLPARRKSLDRPLIPHLETTHRNLTGGGDKPAPARRKSFDRPMIQPPHSPISSSPLSSSSIPHNKPTFSRTKSSLDRPKSSQSMSRTSDQSNDRRSKIMTRSISSVSKSSSSIAHNPHLKPNSDRSALAKTHKNSTRKQPGTTSLISPKPVKKKPAETILHQEPSVPLPESPDHHHTEVSANNPDPNQTETNNNNNNIKTVQEKENIIVVVSDHDHELEDLKSIEDCSFLLSSLPEDLNPPIDPLDIITEEEIISAPENLQEIDTIPPEDHPQVEDKDGGEIINLKAETTPPAADPKPVFEVPVEENGDETIQPSFHLHSHSNSNSSDNSCSEFKAENQEEEGEEEREKEKERDKKPDNNYHHHHHHHHQELADEEVKEITDDQNNNNNNVNVNVVVQSPEANKPALKRNESVVSNDVIEETASKLREQRKNKVKALAGAFETVISLQDK